jgi:argininosuccinate lyase
VKNRNSYGGTSYEQVKMQILAAKNIFANEKKQLELYESKQIKI